MRPKISLYEQIKHDLNIMIDLQQELLSSSC
jgi:hypothetical protein